VIVAAPDITIMIMMTIIIIIIHFGEEGVLKETG
jgi:hypothetical protein